MNKFSFRLYFVALLFLGTLATSCQKSDEPITSPEGIRYIHHTKTEGGKKADPEGMWEVHFKMYAQTEATQAGKDTLISDSYKMGQAVPTTVKGTPFKDVFTIASLGDSMTVFVPADSIKNQNFAKAGTDIRYVFKFVNLLSKSEFETKANQEREAQMKMMLEQRKKMSDAARESQLAKDEDAVIQKYIKDKKLKAEKHESGLYVVYENKGEGDEIKPQAMVSVHYTGGLLDGSVFDSSKGKDPFAFPVMTANVIEGWDVGISLFKKGGKGKLLIPSYMGYGERGAGDRIPANSILIFDVEVVNVAQ